MKDKGITIFSIPLFNRVTVFFFFLYLYYIVNVVTSPVNMGMSGQLLAESNPWNRFMAGLIIVYCLYFVFGTRLYIHDSIYKTALFFMLYMIIRYVFFVFDNPKYALSVAGHLFNVIYWISVLLFAMKCFRFIDKKSLDKLIILLVFIVTLFLTYRLITQKVVLSLVGIVAGINVAGSAYMLVPLIVLVFNGKLRIVMFFVYAFICIYSAKRQALIGMSLVSVLVVKDIVRSYVKEFKAWGVVIVMVITFFGQQYIYNSFEDLVNRQESIESKGGEMDSGRHGLRIAAMKGFMSSNIVTQVFGGGTAISSLYIKENTGTYNAPHCGFVEVLCDYGLVGEILLCCFFLRLFASRKKVSDKKYVYLSIAIAWVYFNIVSHIGNIFAIYLSISFGYLYYNSHKLFISNKLSSV